MTIFAAIIIGVGAVTVLTWMVALLVRVWRDRGCPSPWPPLAGVSSVLLGARLTNDLRVANLATTMGLWALALVTTVEAIRPRYDATRSVVDGGDDGPVDLEQWDR